MPVGKSKNLNREKGEAGERLTQEMFGLAPTSGSGCGRFDKQDSKNDFLRAETKTTNKDHYVLNLKDWERWRQQAAKARSQFFLHLIHEKEDKSLDGENSWVVITDFYWKAIKLQDYKYYAWSENWICPGARSVKIKLKDEHITICAKCRFLDIDFYTGETVSLVAVPAVHFKLLLEKDN